MKEKRILFVAILCILTFAGFVQAEKPGGATMGGERMERQEREGAVPPGRWGASNRAKTKCKLSTTSNTPITRGALPKKEEATRFVRSVMGSSVGN